MAETSGAIRAGRAFVEISAKDTLLMRGLRAAQAKLRAFGAAIVSIGKKLAALGVAAVAPLLASLKIFASQGDALAKMSQRTGITVEALSELGYAVTQSGASMEALEKGIRTMQRNLKEAEDGTIEARDALGQLGLTIDDLRGKSPDEQFKLIADRLSRIEDPTIRAANAMEIFGKSGTTLLPLMADGVAGMEALEKRARDLGLTMDGDAANAAVAFGDNLADVRKQVGKVAFEVGSSLAPALKDLIGRLQNSLRGVIAWVKQNREAVIIAAKVALAVTATGVALIVTGLALKGFAAILGLVMGAFTLFGKVLLGVKVVLLALLSPIGLIAAAIAGLVALIVTKTEMGKHALGALSDAFETLKGDAQLAMSGIRDALAAGDWALAARILWLTLKLEWQRGTNALNVLWQSVKDRFVEVWRSAVATVAKFFVGFVASLKAAWVNFTSFFRSLWENVTSGIASVWSDIQEAVTNTIHDVHGFFDRDFNAEEAKDINRRERAADANQREQERQANLRDIENERTNALADIGREFEGAIDGITRDEQEARQRDQVAVMKALEGTASELEAAKKALSDAVQDARKQRENGAGNGIDFDLNKQLRDIGSDGADDDVPGVLKRFLTTGTFDKFSLQSLQGSGRNFQQQMVQQQMQANDIAKRAVQLLELIRRSLPAFT